MWWLNITFGAATSYCVETFKGEKCPETWKDKWKYMDKDPQWQTN